MRALAKISLLLVIILVALSAYLRLAHSGLGCLDWPDCYGRIGPPPAAAESTTANAYQRLVDQEGTTAAWTTPLHRLVASLLGLAVLGLTMIAWARRYPWKVRLGSLALLGLTVYLAMLGLRSGSLHDPSVVMGNLIGGFAMLALLGGLVFRNPHGHPRESGTQGLATLSVLAVIVVAAQVFTGGLTSANFAATACVTLPDCQGSWLPGPALIDAFDLSPHAVSDDGRAIGGQERVDIHKAHRLGAVATVAITIPLCLAALRRRDPKTRRLALAIAVLVVLEFIIGATAVVFRLPIGLAVTHNWLAALLLLGLVWLSMRLARAHDPTAGRQAGLALTTKTELQ